MPKSSPEKKVEWEERIRLQRESGLSVERWCIQNEIKPYNFNYWRKRIAPQPALNRSSFKELSNEAHTAIVMEYRGIVIRLDKNFDPLILKNCLSVLLEVKC